jgi:hypothetical protein
MASTSSTSSKTFPTPQKGVPAQGLGLVSSSRMSLSWSLCARASPSYRRSWASAISVLVSERMPVWGFSGSSEALCPGANRPPGVLVLAGFHLFAQPSGQRVKGTTKTRDLRGWGARLRTTAPTRSAHNPLGSRGERSCLQCCSLLFRIFILPEALRLQKLVFFQLVPDSLQACWGVGTAE